MILELLTAALPAVSLLALAAIVAVAWGAPRVPVVAVPRTAPVGGRSRQHAVQLRMLPASAHPDAPGRSRPRAPGCFPPAA